MNIAKEIEAEPIGWLLQHQETGRMSFCENDGVNNPTNFVANNPQYILCAPAYAHPAALRQRVEADAPAAPAVESGTCSRRCSETAQCDNSCAPIAAPAAVVDETKLANLHGVRRFSIDGKTGCEHQGWAFSPEQLSAFVAALSGKQGEPATGEGGGDG